MTQAKYLAALKRALSGLPNAAISETLADYTQYFTDGLAEGRTESEIASALGDPKKAASELKAVTRLELFQQQKNLANFWRLLFSLILLLTFNLLLAFPTFIIVILLFSGIVTAVALYFSGIAVIVNTLLGNWQSLPFQVFNAYGSSTLAGASLVLCGTLLLLACLSIGYFGLVGFARYLSLNMSFLRNNG
jgi:uncharacterized membrane protein